MIKWIRWWGILGFAAVVALIAALIIVALPFIIKASIEFVGTKVAGAKVTLDNVDVTLSPLGVRLNHLQVADARSPMQNLVEFDEAVADLELAPLLVGKAISNEVSVSNLQFHTERSESGEIIVEVVDEAESKPSLKEQTLEKLPSADEILAKETLKTPQAADDLKATWAARSEEVDAAIGAVPGQAALDNYETEITAITSGRLESLEDFNNRKARLDELKKQFKKDREAIQQARDTVQASRKELSEKLTTLKKAPGEDLTYLKDKYQLSGVGATNLTGLLFGDDAAGWAKEALYWYNRVLPYLESDGDDVEEEQDDKAPRLAGRFVHFPTSDPWPDFMIRRARLTGPFDGGQLVIEGRDITHQQAIIGHPTVFTATGEGLQKIGDLDAKLTLDHVKPKGQDVLTVAISDWKMAPLELGVAGAELASSRVKLNAIATVKNGGVDASADARVSQAKFSGDGQTVFAKELNAALKGITQFKVNAAVGGRIKNPEIKFGSDLDRQINTAISKRLSAKQDELEARLQSRLNAKVAESAGEYADELQALINMEGSLNDKLNSLKDLAGNELESFKAQQEREAKAKVAEEKAAAQAKIEEEKAAAKAKAKAEADAEKERAKNKAKDKLKSLF